MGSMGKESWKEQDDEGDFKGDVGSS